jgi:hypothetical protein
MVAVPREERRLKHISKPLRVQMKTLIDRTRWPVLVTYSDESVGHTGYVYQCSGWTPTARNKTSTYTRAGARVSRYQNGMQITPVDAVRGEAWIQRWEHWATSELEMIKANWERVATGGVWRSGNPAYTYVRRGTF